MRVLLAIDGSQPSDTARELVAGLAWPPGTTIRVITALAYRDEVVLVPWQVPTPAEAGEIERLRAEPARHLLDDAAASIQQEGVNLETAILLGRPATAIVDEAASVGADVVVVGSRGHGTLGEMLLGSVSAEVVDHAPCPVLVARSGRLTSVLLAEDGSPGAAHARGLIETWPLFRHVPVHVLSVSDVPVPWGFGGWADSDPQVLESYNADLEVARRKRAEFVAAAVASLRNAGVRADGEVAEGDAATRIVAQARDQGVDLVVVGSRGQTGLRRLVLGSVARNVLHNSTASVLVARATPAIEQPAPAG